MSSSQVGDMKAMREALEAIRNLAYEVQDMNREGDVKTSMPTAWVIDIVSAALSKPPRQCDAGTVEEQEKRFQDFCDDSQVDEDFTSMCARCTLRREKHCELAWAQMPYVAEKGAGNEND